MNYFSLPSVSNSDLNALRKAYYCSEDTFDPTGVYKFGNLVDAMLTEEYRVNYWYYSLQDHGDIINYSPSDFELAKAMVKICLKDPVIAAFVAQGSGQHIFDRLLPFQFEGNDYSIQARCKFDSIKIAQKIGCSYKTTSCTTRKSFIESIEHFNYDQQEAWYMDIAEIDRDFICAISKKTKEVFKVAVRRGDELYERGKHKYSFWAYRWLMFVQGFNQTASV